MTSRTGGDQLKGFVARPASSGPMNHFFGYYGIQPWSANGRYLLCLEVPFDDRPPNSDDKATVGMIDLRRLEFVPLAETLAWNFQQGAMMQWVPNEQDSMIFNDRLGNGLASVILDVQTGERRLLPCPISAVSHDGRTALSLNFARLQRARPGYGYAGVSDRFAEGHHPMEDGICLVDLESGENRRVISLRDVFACHRRPPEMKNHTVYFNHTLFNADDSRFAFFVEWRDLVFPEWARIWKIKKLFRLRTAMFTADVDGSDLRCLIDYGSVSHFDWRNSREILVWANARGQGDKFYLVTDGKEECRAIGEGVLNEDGHCSFSPDRRWVLLDTYPDRDSHRTLKVFRWEDGKEFVLARYRSLEPRLDEIRCDLHPRWNRTGTEICFDSTHEGSRQMYLMDVSSLVRVNEGDLR